MKKFALFSCIMLIVAAPASAESTKSKLQKENQNVVEEVQQNAEGSFIHYEPAVVEYRDGVKRDFTLTRLSKKFKQGSSLPGPLIVLKQSLNGELILNPQGQEYPKSTSLKDLSWVDAQILFGEAKNGADGISTFDLQYANGGKCFFTLETKVSDEKLAAYRVIGRGISSPKWTNVH